MRLLRRRTIEPRTDKCLRWLYGPEHIDVQVETQAGARRIVGCRIDSRFQDQHLELLAGLKDLRSLALHLTAVPAKFQPTEAGLVHLQKLPWLHELVLEGCKRIRDAGFEQIGQLRRLRSLQTWQMFHLTDNALKHLGGLTGLRQLALSQTGITGSGLRHLDGLRRLRELCLSGCPTQNVALEHVHLFPELRILHLRSSFSKITDAGLAALHGHPRLEELYLWDLPLIRGPGLKHLAGLSNLKWLFLSGTPLEEKHLVHLADCSQLQLLSLENTPITDRAVDHLLRLTSLRNLHLAETRISGPAFRRLAALKKLRYLTLPDRVKPEDLRYLRQALPGLKFG